MKITNWKPKRARINFNSPQVLAELRREDEVFGRFVGVKTVRIAYGANNGTLRISGILVGRILRDEAGRWCFLPSHQRRKGWYLTLGVREGVPATIVVREIDEIDSKHVRKHWSPRAVAEYMSGLSIAEEIEAELHDGQRIRTRKENEGRSP